MKQISKLYVSLGLGLLTAGIVQAESISPRQALARIESATEISGRLKKKSISSMQLRHTENLPGLQSPAVYLFGAENDGFVIAPADDRFPAVLGYGASAVTDFQQTPPAFKYWISEYARQISYGLSAENQAEIPVRKLTYSTSEWTPVTPLLHTTWNQSAPYNNKCPMDGSKRSVTGCVATSMAQVLKYHNWPQSGYGMASYTFENSSGAQQQVTYNFNSVNFDWDSMLENYTTGGYTQTQADAVAELMFACGASVQMQYSSSESGAPSLYIPGALTRNFKYSPKLRLLNRDYMSSVEWETVIYENLRQGMPVIYNGQSAEGGGHSFVCDGYAGDHYFHINWGWGGLSDSYFLLSLLNPTDQGIGSYAGGYNYDQDIICDIQPDPNWGSQSSASGYIVCNGDFTNGDYVQNGNTYRNVFQVTGPGDGTYGFFNLSGVTFNGKIGASFVSADGNTINLYTSTSNESVDVGYGWGAFQVDFKLVPAGVYDVYPIYLSSSSTEPVRMPVANGYRDHLVMTKKGLNDVSFSNPDDTSVTPRMLATCFSTRDVIYPFNPTTFTMSVTNLSEDTDYYGDLTIYALDASGSEVWQTQVQYPVPAGVTMPQTGSFSLPLSAGEYSVYYRNMNNETIGGPFVITVSNGIAPSVTSPLVVESVTPTEISPMSSKALKFVVHNTSASAVQDPEFKIWVSNPQNGQGIVGWILTLNGSLNSNIRTRIQTPELNFNLPEGIYMLHIEQNISDNVSKPMMVPVTLLVGTQADGITLSQNTAALSVGSTIQLGATVTPAGALYSTVTWQSDNNAVATVDRDGLVHAVSVGEADIVASLPSGKFDICHLTVGNSSVADILASDEDIKAVYDSTGRLMLENPTPSEVKSLPRGVYILVKESGSVKFVK